MRRFFYQFSDISIYSRYFAHIRTMPHAKMQAYVNIDARPVVSIVGLVGEPGRDRVVAEARYIKNPYNNFAELVFFVDEQFQGLGIASYLYKMLIRIGKERGLQGLTASVLSSNMGMLKVFKKGELPDTNGVGKRGMRTDHSFLLTRYSASDARGRKRNFIENTGGYK